MCNSRMLFIFYILHIIYLGGNKDKGKGPAISQPEQFLDDNDDDMEMEEDNYASEDDDMDNY